MTSTELGVLKIIWSWGGEASVDIIAREAGISTDYTRLICENLGREDYIDFLGTKLGRIRRKGKLLVAKETPEQLQKIVILPKPSRSGLGKDKRGRLTLNYG